MTCFAEPRIFVLVEIDSRVIPVSGDKLLDMLLPKVVISCTTCAYILVIPFIVKLIYNKNAIFITKVKK